MIRDLGIVSVNSLYNLFYLRTAIFMLKHVDTRHFI